MKSEKAKDYFYIGYYLSTFDMYILKLGRTDDYERRAKEHTRYYKHKVKNQPMKENEQFNYIALLPLSPANADRVERKNLEIFKKLFKDNYIQKERFVFDKLPKILEILSIRKTYTFIVNV